MARMDSPAIAESKAERPKKTPKVLEEVSIRRSMDGGHAITHRYQGYQHDPRTFNFGKGEGARAAAHIQRHTQIPMGAAKDMVDEGEGDD